MSSEVNELDIAELLKIVEQNKSNYDAKMKALYHSDRKAYNAIKAKEKRARTKKHMENNPEVIAEKERVAEIKRVEKEQEEIKLAEKRRKREERRALRDARINAQKEKSNVYKNDIEETLNKVEVVKEYIKGCYFFPRIDSKENIYAFKIHVQYYVNKKLKKTNAFTVADMPIPLIDQAKMFLLKILTEIEKEIGIVQIEELGEETIEEDVEPTDEELDEAYNDFDLGDL